MGGLKVIEKISGSAWGLIAYSALCAYMAIFRTIDTPELVVVLGWSAFAAWGAWTVIVKDGKQESESEYN